MALATGLIQSIMWKWFKQTFVFAVGAALGIQLGVRVLMKFKPLIAPLWLSPVRMLYRNPQRVLDFAGLHRGQTVLDLGCGSGLFAIEAAQRVGAHGTVHAVDVQPEMLDRLTERLRNADLQNVQTHLGSATKLPLPDASVDHVFMISVLPMIADKGVALREVFRVLRPGGTLVVGEEILVPEYVRAKTIQRWADNAGFNLVASEGWAIEYLLKFTRPMTAVEMVREAMG
jgi:ubiquinone/menaquinone biosynthesis C-methylase UbiE